LFASRTSTVSVFVAPDATEAVDDVKTSLLAAPGVTVNTLVAEVRPIAEAVIVTEPPATPVTVFCAMPPLAVAVPSPLTEPLPDVCAKSTAVELSVVTRLSLASRTSTVSVFVAPDATDAVDDAKTTFVAGPTVTLNELVSEVSPDADAVIVTGPAVAPVTTFDATPPLAVAVPSPVTEPVPDVCANVTTVELSDVTRLLLASRT
jgi:hypothetical protein